jgi:hypothetical protein
MREQAVINAAAAGAGALSKVIQIMFARNLSLHRFRLAAGPAGSDFDKARHEPAVEKKVRDAKPGQSAV